LDKKYKGKILDEKYAMKRLVVMLLAFVSGKTALSIRSQDVLTGLLQAGGHN
jgi:hypothetical protein